ncbi:zinc finger MYM-type protein 1-like [Capsicum annuum]|uniref:zinc finger MYM-type protein 1-like n=1 Tax=Capsicum annuum TaxID=4072 RepID=UPI001FB0BD5B|nr:zinc finger MYM-type protein 1-like [Capsicum annuum]
MDRYFSPQPSSSFKDNSPRLIEEFDVNSLKFDPGERKSIHEYHSTIRDQVRRHYIQQGPCQSILSQFPQTRIGMKMRQFNSTWYERSYSRWMEYSVKKDVVFCLCCYLFKNDYVKDNASDFFTKTGFKAWNHNLERFQLHVGDVNSVHRRCFNKMLDFENQSQSIQVALNKQSEKIRSEHRTRLKASTNDIVSACAQETVKAIIDDLDGDFFEILVDESKDISHHEKMAIALRYVNKKGKVNERVIAIVRVGDTSTKMLKEIIFSVLMRHSLSTSKIHEQGYDGASNMQGEMNGLKALILQETPSAYCIHCFAHQLQLTLVAVVKKHFLVNDFFVIITNVLNVVGASFKRRDQLRDHQAEILEQLLESGEIQSGKGLNQERGLKRPGDTRWGSHFRSLNNFIILSSSIAHVLDAIKCGGSNPNDRLQEGAFLTMINEFEFVFLLYLMLKILVMSNELSASLQTKEKILAML